MNRIIAISINTSSTWGDSKNRLVEIGAVEILDQVYTGNNFHIYLNPEVDIEIEAIEQHGIVPEFLQDKPRFSQIAEQFSDYLENATIITFGSEVAQLVNDEFAQTSNSFRIENILDYKQKLNDAAPDVNPSVPEYCAYYGIAVPEEYSSALLNAERLIDLYQFLTATDRIETTTGDYVFNEYSDFDDFINQMGKFALYRGVNNKNYELIPSLFRQRRNETNIDVVEDQLMNMFQKQTIHLVKQRPTNMLQWMVLAQHHGLPTRLLDWSLSPLVAAFFAAHGLPDKDGAIYCYQPESFQKEDELKLDGLANIKAFYPSHTSRRVTAQSGMFTIHPTSSTKLVSKRIKKMVLPADRKQNLIDKLLLYGINHSSIFPDLDGICKNLKHQFGY